jgi:hypothetical protein
MTQLRQTRSDKARKNLDFDQTTFQLRFKGRAAAVSAFDTISAWESTALAAYRKEMMRLLEVPSDLRQSFHIVLALLVGIALGISYGVSV